MVTSDAGSTDLAVKAIGGFYVVNRNRISGGDHFLF